MLGEWPEAVTAASRLVGRRISEVLSLAPMALKTQIVEVIRTAEKPMTRADICQALDRNTDDQTVKEELAKVEKAGEVLIVGGRGKVGSPYLYSLPTNLPTYQ
jgi:predicted MarR family transcription regulator